MALFDLEQHYGDEPPKEWKRPTFKDCAAAEIKTTFFNETEFAELHNVDGVDALIVLEDVDVREHAAHWEAGAKQNFDTGLYDSYRILYISVEDYGEMPQSGDLVTIDEGTKDEQMFTLKNCEDENGIYRMILEKGETGVMSIVTYDAGQMLLTVDDTGVERALGNLYRKTPAVLKVAINRTARQARKDLISEAEKRYALTVRGKARLRLLKLRKSATNTRLEAELRQGDQGLTLNASYFRHSPTIPRMGLAALNSPAFQRVQTLQGGPMEELAATGGESKGFLIRVSNAENDHLMFAHRLLGSSTSNTTTKTGKPRWRNRAGSVEKAYDVNRIGASSQQTAVWYRGVDNAAAENLEQFLEERIAQVIAASK